VRGPVVVVDVERLVEADVDGVDGLRLFSGYSGWGPGQLDGELAAGVWQVVDAGPDDVLCADPGTLWRSILRRQGGRSASLGLFPDDPSVN
jgi:putative transcriptional regulator